MKRIWSGSILFGVFLFCTSSAFAVNEVKLIASSSSDRYHVTSCKIAKKIWPDELIRFHNPEEAVTAGLNPCKKCNPPTKTKTKDDR